MAQHKSLWTVAPLFLVLAIDSMGLGILFPILSSMIIDPTSPFLSHTLTPGYRELLYGIVIGIYMIAQFLGSAMLGDFSDIVGRKKSLMLCLMGAAIGYFISGIGIECHSITLLILGRVVAGFTAGSQPIAQAAIMDISPNEHKARNIGYILLAVSLGFVIGPLAGGVLSHTQWVSWFNYSTPMWFAAIASIFNVLFLHYCFSETFTITRKVKLRFHHAIQIFIEAFQHKKIRYLALVFFIFTAGWGEYFSFVSQYLLLAYHYTALQTSLFITLLAIGFSIGFSFLVERCLKLWSQKNAVIIGLFIGGLICAMTALIHIQWLAWVGALVIGMAIAISYSVLITICSNQVGANEQGWVMGVTSAVGALSFGVTTFFSGFAANFGADVPILFGCGMLLISALLMLRARC